MKVGPQGNREKLKFIIDAIEQTGSLYGGKFGPYPRAYKQIKYKWIKDVKL